MKGSTKGPVGRRLLFSGSLSFRGAMLAAVFSVFGAVLALGTPLVAQVLFNALQIYPPLTTSNLSAATKGPLTAIVILTAGSRGAAAEFEGEFGNETVDALSLERVRYGAYLARKTDLPILVSGGLGSSDENSLASLMTNVLWTDYGMRAKWLESRSINTAENAIFSAEILKHARVNRILLVTHAWHMKRAVAAFAANGMVVIPAPTVFYVGRRDSLWAAITPGLATLRMSGYAIHEIVGSFWYELRYGY